MKFANARPCKWFITYTIDSDPEHKVHSNFFTRHSALCSWMDNNEDKTIIRMTISYKY